MFCWSWSIDWEIPNQYELAELVTDRWLETQAQLGWKVSYDMG